MRSVGSVDDLLADIDALHQRKGAQERLMVAIVGAPGAGKSTLADQLQQRMSASQIVPMDGFHLDNRLLQARDQLAVKGAPETFDAEGLHALLTRIAADEDTVHVPVFDRDADLSRAAARTVLPEHRKILVEGNYLLLDQGPWSALRGLFDVSVFVSVPQEQLRERLVKRWLDQGLEPAPAQARAEQNDIPNGLRVIEDSIPADIQYTPG